MRWLGLSPEEITARCEAMAPGARDAAEHGNVVVPWSKRQMRPHEAAVLYVLAHAYDKPGARILEIGTALGYSAAVLAQAAPSAKIVTLNPKLNEYTCAFGYLSGEFKNVEVLCVRSEDFLAGYGGPELDFVFVDGDHTANGVRRDFGWLRCVKVGGLVLFHDYCPNGAERACPSVKEAVDELAQAIGRGPDVLVSDDLGNGMAGWHRDATRDAWPIVAGRMAKGV